MIVLVCGGRDFSDEVLLSKTLDNEHITMLIHGGARGADSLAGAYARRKGIQEVICPANWDFNGKKAGVLRNKAMLNLMPDMVIAFPGGTGTENMCSVASKAGVQVLAITSE